MKIDFTQCFIEPGVTFPFSIRFRDAISDGMSEILKTADVGHFRPKWKGYDLTICISAKSKIRMAEVAGPGVYRRDRELEYTVFLPYEALPTFADAVGCLVDTVCGIIGSLGIDIGDIGRWRNEFVALASTDPAYSDDP